MRNPTKPAKPKTTPFLQQVSTTRSAVLLPVSQTFPAQERQLWFLSVALYLGQVLIMEAARRRQVCIDLVLDALRCFIGSITLVSPLGNFGRLRYG